MALATLALGLAVVADTSDGSALTWRPALLAGVPGSNGAYVVEYSGSPCHAMPRLRLVTVSVEGRVGAARSLPPVGSVACDPAGTISYLRFATDDDGAITEYPLTGRVRLYVTTDGGHLWTHRPLSGAFPPGASPSFDVTASGVSYLSATCATEFTESCRGFALESTSWGSTTWTTRRLPVTLALAGITAATFGPAVWVNVQGHAVTILHSGTGRPPFTTWHPSALGSVAGCHLTPTSPIHLWAECPTGMMVSFWASTDAGRTWLPLTTHHDFFGTGGGAFDPVSSSLAFLDLGPASVAHGDDVVRYDGQGRATPVGRLGCYSVGSLDFVNARDGLADCSAVSASSARPAIERTSDGGRTWRVVALTPE